MRLLRGLDDGKDQSYMLHMLGQRELRRSLFPVGGMPKAATREHARRFGLPVADKPDSQELCFAPAGEAGAFVRGRAPELVHAGTVVDPDGRVLAGHDGTFGFTIGQRRGLGVATGERSYVVDLDAARTASSSARASCSRAGAWSPTAPGGWPGRRPPPVPSRPRSGSGTAARTSPPSSHPTATGSAWRSPGRSMPSRRGRAS